MAIVSSSVLGDTVQADGRRSIRLQWVAHTGEMVTRGGLVPAGFDTSAALAAGNSDALASLAAKEYSTALAAILSGVGVTAVLASLQHSTVRSILKSLLRELMKADDPRIVIGLKPVALHINATYTDNQVKSELGITQSKLNAYKARVRAVVSNVGTMEYQIKEMDNTLAQWGDE